MSPTNAMEGAVLNGQHSVLIVDRSQETREVLQTVLERRGVHTLATGRAAAGVELIRRHHPDLVVLDLETEDLADGEFSDQPRLVLLGSMRRQGDRLPGGEFVAKPYHYSALIRRIEELLDCCTRESGPCRHCSSSAEPIRETASS
jgi:DNA-binding response OmpR family regulator